MSVPESEGTGLEGSFTGRAGFGGAGVLGSGEGCCGCESCGGLKPTLCATSFFFFPLAGIINSSPPSSSSDVSSSCATGASSHSSSSSSAFGSGPTLVRECTRASDVNPSRERLVSLREFLVPRLCETISIIPKRN